MSAERVCHHVRMRGAELVRALYERYQARDWTGAAALLHPEAQLRMPATDEYLLGRQQVLAFQRNYPEPWGELRVLRAASDSTVAVAEIAIVRDTDVFRCAAFWTTQEDTLLSGVEYWVTVVVTSRHRTALSPRTDSGPLDSGAAGPGGWNRLPSLAHEMAEQELAATGADRGRVDDQGRELAQRGSP